MHDTASPSENDALDDTWTFTVDGEEQEFTTVDEAELGGFVVVADAAGDHLCRLGPAVKMAGGLPKSVPVAADVRTGDVRVDFEDADPADTLGVVPVEPA